MKPESERVMNARRRWIACAMSGADTQHTQGKTDFEGIINCRRLAVFRHRPATKTSRERERARHFTSRPLAHYVPCQYHGVRHRDGSLLLVLLLFFPPFPLPLPPSLLPFSPSRLFPSPAMFTLSVPVASTPPDLRGKQQTAPLRLPPELLKTGLRRAEKGHRRRTMPARRQHCIRMKKRVPEEQPTPLPPSAKRGSRTQDLASYAAGRGCANFFWKSSPTIKQSRTHVQNIRQGPAHPVAQASPPGIEN